MKLGVWGKSQTPIYGLLKSMRERELLVVILTNYITASMSTIAVLQLHCENLIFFRVHEVTETG